MKSDDPQLVLPTADVFTHRHHAARLKAACRATAIERGFAVMATELDAAFGPEGRPVSTSMLHNTLNPDHERNYARLEWVPAFASYNADVAEIVASAAGLTLAPARKLSPEAELELLKERVTREFGVAGARLVMNVGSGRRR